MLQSRTFACLTSHLTAPNISTFTTFYNLYRLSIKTSSTAKCITTLFPWIIKQTLSPSSAFDSSFRIFIAIIRRWVCVKKSPFGGGMFSQSTSLCAHVDLHCVVVLVYQFLSNFLKCWQPFHTVFHLTCASYAVASTVD